MVPDSPDTILQQTFNAIQGGLSNLLKFFYDLTVRPVSPTPCAFVCVAYLTDVLIANLS